MSICVLVHRYTDGHLGMIVHCWNVSVICDFCVRNVNSLNKTVSQFILSIDID